MKKIFISLIALVLSYSIFGQNTFRKEPYIFFKNKVDQVTGEVLPELDKIVIRWQLNNFYICYFYYGTEPPSGPTVIADYDQINDIWYYELDLEENLYPGTKYYYSAIITEDDIPIDARNGTFVTPDNSVESLIFYAYSDIQNDGNTPQVPSPFHEEICGKILNEINTEDIKQTFILHCGDWNHGNVDISWDENYFNTSQIFKLEMLSKLPVMGIYGNHDQFPVNGTSVLEKYWSYSFIEPIPHPLNRWYSFDYGPIHISCLDLYYENIAVSAAQQEWLISDLEETDKEWKIILFHSPIYSSAPPGQEHPSNLYARPIIKSICEEYGVQMTLSGHNHHYAHWAVNETHYLTIGGCADDLYPVQLNQGEISAASIHHFSKFSIDNDLLTVNIIDNNGVEFESFSIPKSLQICDNENVIWNKDLNQIGDVRICSGSTLTITSIVGFMENAKIIVERDAKLILDGGTLTNACEGMWKGIEVWGTSAQGQVPTYQGWVQVINGGKIENSLMGIYTNKPTETDDGWEPGYTGGIVQCEDADFVNNKIAAQFFPYHYNSASHFVNCTFKTDDDYLGTLNPEYFMNLDGILQFRINNCDFINETSTPYFQSGIYSNNSVLFIDGNCLSGSPCAQWDNGLFRDLYYGIYSIVSYSDRYIDIRHTDFNWTKRGIYISATDGARVTSCNFNMPAVEGSVINDYYGLYLNNSFSYHVEDNHFIGPAPGAGGIGMYINNSGTHWNQIYNNTCSGLNYGTIAYGLNRNSFTSVGLCIECNDYDNNKYDIVVNGLMGGSGHGIAHDQGQLGANDTLPAGNTFTQNYSGLVYNYKNSKSMAFINYVYHGHNFTSEKVNPFPYYSSQTMSRQANTQTTYDKDLACPSKLESGGGGGEERIEMEYAMEQMEMKKDQLEELVDGGDTYFMNLGVVTSTPPEAAGVYNELMGESPYLSDTVMKSAIYKENVLPNAMVRDVLVANPQSAKSSEIMDAVDERFEPMPEWMKEQVLEGVSITGAKETLESVIRFWDRKRSDHFENLYQHFRKDTINIQASMDSLELLLAQDNRIESKYRLAFVKMQQGSWSECQAVLNSIPAEFELTPQEESVHQDYFSMFMVLSQLNGNLPVEGSAEAVDLEWLAARDEFYPGACARDILLAARLIEYHEPVILPEEELKSSEVIKNNTLNKSNKPEVLKVFPNPAGDYFIVEYDAEGYSGDISIKANDMTGKQLFINNYSLKRDQVVLNVEDWKSGVYHINLLVNGKLIKSEKISIK
jgi:hypothetical protein